MCLSIKRLLFLGFIHELQDKCFMPSCHKSMVVFSVSIVTIVSIVEKKKLPNEQCISMILSLHQEDLDFGIPPPPTSLDLQLIPKLIYRSMHAKKAKDNPRHGFRILRTGFRILCQLNLDSGFHLSGIPDS